MNVIRYGAGWLIWQFCIAIGNVSPDLISDKITSWLDLPFIHRISVKTNHALFISGRIAWPCVTILCREMTILWLF
jgi:hypothetical protein